MSRGALAQRATLVSTQPTSTELETLRAQLARTDVALLQNIEAGAYPVKLDGTVWRDVRPLLDEREVCPTTADTTRELLDYLAQRGLLLRHGQHAHLVRAAVRPA
jgi:hypothetical protein